MAVAGKVAPVPKGEWAIGTSYNKIDIVTHNKDAYIALQNNIGQEPTRSGSAYWSLLMEHPGDNGCFVGTCSTGGSTAAKTVTISDTIILEAGVVVMVKYTYDNTAASPTLNINSTGAKSIHYNGAAITSSDLWTAGEADLYEIYVYDGTYWVWVGHSVNSGGVTEDTVAPVEQSPSTHAYTVGKQLYYNGVLYTAIDDIAINDALTVGTNIQASDDLVTQIANAGKGVNTDKTMQEYQALTPEQQADPDTYYWIDDDPGIDYDNIRDIVAPTEYSTAVGGHSTGDEFILGDYLYKALSTIQQGDPIVTSGGSANATLAGTIVSQIKALFDGETVLKNMKTMITDCNTGNTTQGIRWYLVDTQSANAPTTSYGILLEIVRYSAQVNQFYMVFSGSDYSIYFRSKGSGSWPTTGGYGWKQIYGASLLSGTQQATTIASAVNTVIATIANVPAGTYLVTGRITYEANTNGIRDIGITDSSTSGTMEGTETATVSGATTMSATRYITLSSTGTIYLKGYQTSGSTLNISNYELKAHIM